MANRGLHAWRTGGLHLFRDFAALASGQMIGRVLNFVAFAFLARVLDPVGYGAVEYVVGLSVFFAMVVDAGLGPIGVRRVMRHPDELDTLAFQIPFARLLIAVAGVPAMALFAIAAMKGAAPAALVWLFALSLLTAPWRQEWLLQASGRMTEAAIAQVVRAVVFAIAVWTLVRAPRDLMFVGWAEIASVTTMTAYTLWIQHIRIARLRVHRSFTGLGRLLREGWGLGLTNLVWAMIQYAPLFLAGAILSGAPIAWFGAALRLMSSLITFSNLYHFNLYPAVAKAAAEGPEALRRLMRRSFRVVAWGGIAAALALTLFAAPATRIIFGPKLVQAAPLLQVLAWTLPITLLSSHSRWGLVAVSAQTRALWSHVAGLVVLVIVSLLLGLQWGAIGFALGAIAGVLAVWVVSHAFAARHGAQPPPFTLAARPAALAGVIVAAKLLLVPAAFWAAPSGLLLFVLAGPVLDPKLLPDLIQLGRSKLDRDGPAKSTQTA